MSKKTFDQHNQALTNLAEIFSRTVDNRTGRALPGALSVGLYPLIADNDKITVAQAVDVAHYYAYVMEN